jgi:hypothetical protein
VAYSFTGDPDDPSLDCRVSDFSYVPADRGGFFQAGAEVTVHVICEAPVNPEGETPEGETPEGETPEGETPEGETPEGGTPEGETPEGETTEEETSGAGDEVPAEEPVG